MPHSETELTAHCGLYCADCIRFHSRAARLAAELAQALESEGWDQYALAKASATAPGIKGAREFADYDRFRAVLAALADQACGSPCRAGGDGCATGCTIKACAEEKGLTGCWQCTDMESCGKLEMLVPFGGENLRGNLRIIRDTGLEGWAARRLPFYKWR